MLNRYSEPQYIDPSEWVMLSTNFTAFRLFYQVLYNTNQNVPWLTDRLPQSTDPIGTGAMGYVLNGNDPTVSNNSWTVVINSVNANVNGYYKHQITAKALQCPLEGCPVPAPPVSAVH